MGYRRDQYYKFACRSYQAGLGELLRWFDEMPHDPTVRVVEAENFPARLLHDLEHGDPAHLSTGGAFVMVSLTTRFISAWESPTLEWLLKFREDQRRTDPQGRQLECELFCLDEDYEYGHVFGIERWEPERPRDGSTVPTVVEQLRQRQAARGDGEPV